MSEKGKKINWMTQSVFARYVDVDRSAIHQAINKLKPPKVFIETVDTKKLINPDHPVNVKYRENSQARNSGNKNEVKLAKAKARAAAELTEKLIADKLNLDDLQQPQQSQQPQLQPTVQNPANAPTGFDPEMLKNSSKMDIQKIQLNDLKIRKQMIEHGQMLKQLVAREDVEKFNGITYSTIESNFLNLDEMVTPKIMAICGISNPEIALKVKKEIARQSVNGLEQLKGQLESFADHMLTTVK